jgi:predicted ATPase/DNA-binding CsgD family transcriptional regulator
MKAKACRLAHIRRYNKFTLSVLILRRKEMKTRVSKTGEVLVEPLTRREREILVLLAQGFSAPEIAQQLILALSTVKWYVQQVYGKLGVNNKQRAILRAGELGLLETYTPVADVHFSPKHNLPSQLTSFIGRKKDVEGIQHRLEGHRLVTLIGVGGIGKTRLSQQVANQLIDSYANGVWLVEFAALADPALVPQSVATVFGIQQGANHSALVETIIDFLNAKTILLILDNCEHLLDACAGLADKLLKSCPNLHILATSREALGIIGEALYPVPSLTIPDVQQISLIEKLNDYESIRLFNERAQLVQMDFALTKDNAASVTQICSRLDGIPLAIELAAVRVRTFSAEQIAEQLDHCFHVLTGGSRTALPKQQTLQASIDWSWQLLDHSEQMVLSRLSMFAGGWTLEAAEAVCVGNGVEVYAVLDLMTQLVNKSLILAERARGQEARYRILGTIRKYARERLIELGEEENLSTRHLKYFLGLSEEAEAALRGPTQMEWYAWLNDERDNIRTALEWADKTNVEAGLYLSSRLGIFWYIFDLYEGSYWLSKFLARSESHTCPGARAKALYVYGQLLVSMQQSDAANSVVKESLELYCALRDQQGEVDGLILQASIISDAIEKIQLKRRALELAQSLGDVPRQVSALWQLGYSSRGKNRFIYWEKAIGLTRSSGDVRGLANSLSTMGLQLALNHDIESAQKYLDESYMLYQQFNLNPTPRDLLSGYGQIALMRGDYEKARTSFQEEATTSIEYGNRQDFLWAHARMGYVALHEGNLDEARRIFAEVARDFQKDKYTSGVAFALEGMAGIDLAMNQNAYAARLVGWSDRTREKTGDLRPILEQANIDEIVAACLARMGNVAFWKAYDEGKKMTLDEAVSCAIDNS